MVVLADRVKAKVLIGPADPAKKDKPASSTREAVWLEPLLELLAIQNQPMRFARSGSSAA